MKPDFRVLAPTSRGGGPLVISHKCRLFIRLILAPRPPMHFLHKIFPGTYYKTSHCAKFHSSSCLISWLPKTELCETIECSPPLHIRDKAYFTLRASSCRWSHCPGHLRHPWCPIWNNGTIPDQSAPVLSYANPASKFMCRKGLPAGSLSSLKSLKAIGLPARKHFLSTFLVQLFARFCCSYVVPHITIRQWGGSLEWQLKPWDSQLPVVDSCGQLIYLPG